MSDAKHSHPKKVALPKGALLLKLLSAFCVINSVGAVAVPGLLNSPSPTCGCSEEIEALREEIGAKEVAYTAEIDALNQNLEAVLKYIGMAPSTPHSPPPSTPPSPPPPSPSPPPPSPSPPPLPPPKIGRASCRERV